MKTTRLFLIIAMIVSSASGVAAYTEEQLRGGLKLFLHLQGFECAYIADVEMREEPRAFNILCNLQEDGSGEEILYFFQFVGDGAVVEIINNEDKS
ncbi:MAG: hypothetical protein AAED33_07505 [Paracoccaceae bacterium]